MADELDAPGENEESGFEVHGLTPNSIAPPFARYSHGVVLTAPGALILTSGQLGLAADGSVPDGVEEQADICFANIDAILAEAGTNRGATLHVRAFVTDRKHMQGYMKSRDRWLADITPPPASTLMIVSGFTREEFKVEIEVVAAA
ncbi:MAG: RidA family protein [Pseudomonadota bacterium]